jgi:hypothetical protein
MKFLLTSFVLLGSSAFSNIALSEALSTTSIGTGSRQLQWVPASSGDASGSNTLNKEITEVLSGPVICHRVSAPSSIFTLEIGASGCLMKGSGRNFASSMSGHFTLLYYPFSSRMKVSNEDTAVRLKQISFTNIFLSGKTGFSKTTFGFGEASPVSYTVDSVDVGLGLGYSYRLFKHVAVGAEVDYIYSSSISPQVATGSSNLMEFLALFTVFL